MVENQTMEDFGEPIECETVLKEEEEAFDQDHFDTEDIDKIDELIQIQRRKIKLLKGREYVKCSYCPKYFKYESLRERHEVAHQTERPYTCDPCDKTFKRPSEYRRHMAWYHQNPHPKIEKREVAKDDNPFKCNFCNQTFERQPQILYHIATQHSDEDGTKEIDQELARQNETKENIETGLDKRFQFICKFCGKGFPYKCELDRHIVCHSEIRPFPCKYCGKAFKHKFTLNQHANNHCPKIKEHFEDFQSFQLKNENPAKKLKMEQIAKTLNGMKIFNCQHCDKVFPFKSALKRHEVCHYDGRPFRCEGCDQTFKHRYTLNQHEKSLCSRLKRNIKKEDTEENDEEGDLNCQFCGKIFKDRFQCQQHKRIHEDQPYFCTLCKKTFQEKSEADAHEAVHLSDLKDSPLINVTVSLITYTK